jgi:medium-chain acyl-[acyl-carrier-protein] hydrolase
LLKSLNGTPQSLFEQPELLELLMPVLRADFELIQTYVYSPEPPLACPITAFGGLCDPQVRPADVNAWRMQTTADFSVQMFDGDHFFLHSCESLLLEFIARQLGVHSICY